MLVVIHFAHARENPRAERDALNTGINWVPSRTYWPVLVLIVPNMAKPTAPYVSPLMRPSG